MKKVFFRGRQDKIELITKSLQCYLAGDVLDVGCDKKYIKPFLSGRYIGIDISGNPDVLLNVEQGLPFYKKSVDTVIAFDVLEHLERLHFVFDEICRVAKYYVIVGLPNMYEWRFRLMNIIGKPISGKYGLPFDAPSDRHRWLFSLNDAREFIQGRGEKNGFRILDEILGYYKYRKFMARIITSFGCFLGSNVETLFAYYYCSVLERQK